MKDKHIIIPTIFDPMIVDAVRNKFEHVSIEESSIDKILIKLKIRKRMNPVKIKRRMLCDLIPKVKNLGTIKQW